VIGLLSVDLNHELATCPKLLSPSFPKERLTLPEASFDRDNL
jgi:hypothetical protein